MPPVTPTVPFMETILRCHEERLAARKTRPDTRLRGELRDVRTVHFRAHGRGVLALHVGNLPGSDLVLGDAARFARTAGNHRLGPILQLASATGGYQHIAEIAVVFLLDTHRPASRTSMRGHARSRPA